MKKVKIMLLSLALFAVVGGALAFKAKYQTKFCTAEYNNGCPAACPALIDQRTTTDEGGLAVCTTLPTTTTKVDGVIVPQVSTCTTYNAQGTPFTRQCAALSTSIIQD